MQNNRELYVYYNNDNDHDEGSEEADEQSGQYKTLTTEQQVPNEYQSLQRSQPSSINGERDTTHAQCCRSIEELKKQLKVNNVYLASITVILVITVATSITAVILASVVRGNQNELLSLKAQLLSLSNQPNVNGSNTDNQVTQLKTKVNIIKSKLHRLLPIAPYENCHQDTSSCVTMLLNGSNLLSCRTPSRKVNKTVSL